MAKLDAPSSPKRRRMVSFNARTIASVAPTIGDIRDRYADFLSPLSAEQDQQSVQNARKNIEMEDLCQRSFAFKQFLPY